MFPLRQERCGEPWVLCASMKNPANISVFLVHGL